MVEKLCDFPHKREHFSTFWTSRHLKFHIEIKFLIEIIFTKNNFIVSPAYSHHGNNGIVSI